MRLHYFALLDFIGGVDFHEENFIIHRTSPVPIDLEGVFSPIEIPQNIDNIKGPFWTFRFKNKISKSHST